MERGVKATTGAAHGRVAGRLSAASAPSLQRSPRFAAMVGKQFPHLASSSSTLLQSSSAHEPVRHRRCQTHSTQDHITVPWAVVASHLALRRGAGSHGGGAAAPLAGRAALATRTELREGAVTLGSRPRHGSSAAPLGKLGIKQSTGFTSCASPATRRCSRMAITWASY